MEIRLSRRISRALKLKEFTDGNLQKRLRMSMDMESGHEYWEKNGKSMYLHPGDFVSNTDYIKVFKPK